MDALKKDLLWQFLIFRRPTRRAAETPFHQRSFLSCEHHIRAECTALLIVVARRCPMDSQGGERQSDFLMLNAFLAIGWCVFWVMLYTWNDRRFILYLLFFLTPCIAIALRYCYSLFTRARLFGKALWMGLYLLAVAGSAIPYESGFTLNLIKLTPTIAIKFKSVSDPATFNTSIDATSFGIARDRNGFNPVHVRRLWEMRRNIDWGELEKLSYLRQEIIGKNIPELCIIYDALDLFRWYIDKNRYGNYFKMKVRAYPECSPPTLRMAGGGLQLM